MIHTAWAMTKFIKFMKTGPAFYGLLPKGAVSINLTAKKNNLHVTNTISITPTA